jgi:DNA-binding transcriptional LysR family regulator
MQITLRQIRYFLAAAETGQFSAAADQVHVTQTAITAAIKELEGILGVDLFERHHASGVSLTTDGQRFMQHAFSITSAVNAAMSSPGVLPKQISGRVHLVLTPQMFAYYAIPALARFKAAQPLIDLVVTECSRIELEERVASGQADIGMVWLNSLENITELDALGLSRSRRQLWLCADHPLLKRRQVSLHDVAQLPYVMNVQDEVQRNSLRFWKEAGLQPNVVYEAESIEAVRSLVAYGMAVTILGDVAYRPFSTQGLRIYTRPLQEGLPPIEIGLAWRRDHELPPSVAIFKDFMEMTYRS